MLEFEGMWIVEAIHHVSLHFITSSYISLFFCILIILLLMKRKKEIVLYLKY